MLKHILDLAYSGSTTIGSKEDLDYFMMKVSQTLGFENKLTMTLPTQVGSDIKDILIQKANFLSSFQTEDSKMDTFEVKLEDASDEGEEKFGDQENDMFENIDFPSDFSEIDPEVEPSTSRPKRKPTKKRKKRHNAGLLAITPKKEVNIKCEPEYDLMDFPDDMKFDGDPDDPDSKTLSDRKLWIDSRQVRIS